MSGLKSEKDRVSGCGNWKSFARSRISAIIRAFSRMGVTSYEVNPGNPFDSSFGRCGSTVALQQKLGILAQRRCRTYPFDCINPSASGAHLGSVLSELLIPCGVPTHPTAFEQDLKDYGPVEHSRRAQSALLISDRQRPGVLVRLLNR